MGWKARLSKPFAAREVRRNQRWMKDPITTQHKLFEHLIKKGANTAFGRDHRFEQIANHKSFVEAVPTLDYEGNKSYFDRVAQGESDVLWPGKPIYISKTSGTTSGVKYIPISRDSIGHHIRAARSALLHYIHETGRADFVEGKMIFLQGSPELIEVNGIKTGRLSGIVAHHVPSYLMRNRMPSWETNCIEDWEKKVDAIVQETSTEDMSLFSGIPSWVQMYFERLLEHTGKTTVSEVFPNFSVFVYGGVNFSPYKPIFKELIGNEVDGIETYPASEGFIAFQDQHGSEDLLLNLDGGIFYEFIPLSEIHNETPTRLALEQVELDQQYAVVLTTDAGLWSYLIGDTVRFTSLEPFRIRVTGRVKHFTSAFGEHVIAEEVESAMKEAMEALRFSVREFHMAPQVKPAEGLPYHEWFVEFESSPDIHALESFLDENLQGKNPYYKDLIQGNILRRLIVRPVKEHGFHEAMKSRGKLGGQNKIPRLANDRGFAELIENFRV